jgi:hypothetical protein
MAHSKKPFLRLSLNWLCIKKWLKNKLQILTTFSLYFMQYGRYNDESYLKELTYFRFCSVKIQVMLDRYKPNWIKKFWKKTNPHNFFTLFKNKLKV